MNKQLAVELGEERDQERWSSLEPREFLWISPSDCSTGFGADFSSAPILWNWDHPPETWAQAGMLASEIDRIDESEGELEQYVFDSWYDYWSDDASELVLDFVKRKVIPPVELGNPPIDVLRSRRVARWVADFGTIEDQRIVRSFYVSRPIRPKPVQNEKDACAHFGYALPDVLEWAIAGMVGNMAFATAQLVRTKWLASPLAAEVSRKFSKDELGNLDLGTSGLDHSGLSLTRCRTSSKHVRLRGEWAKSEKWELEFEDEDLIYELEYLVDDRSEFPMVVKSKKRKRPEA